jgi:hypothetical protein
LQTVILKSNYDLKVSLKQQLLVLFPFLFINSGITIGYFFAVHVSFFNSLIIGTTVFFFIANVLTVLVLHTQYLYFNRSMSINIDSNSGDITIIQSGKEYSYKVSDIKALDYYSSSGHISKKGPDEFYTFDPYRFFKIVFNDNRHFYVTSLMMNNIERNLEQILGYEANWHFRVLALIY